MRKPHCLFWFLLVLLLPLGSPFALTKEEAAQVLREVVKREFKILEVREAPLDGFWEIVADLGQEKIVIYLHKNLRYILHGQILDRQAKRNLTLERLKDFRKVDVSTFPLEHAFSMGSGKRRLFVFTDPQCQLCALLHEELKGIANLQVHFFLFPLNATSYEKAKAIWCSQDKLKSLEEAYLGKEVTSPACNTLAINKNIELGQRLFIHSTPTLILQSGKVVEGYVPKGALENLLTSD